jgi:hypothetical protein
MNACVLGSMVLGALCAFVAMLGVAAGGLLLAAAPALAAAPETPEVKVESVTAYAATFHGVLNPAAPAPSEGGTYKFLYKAGTPTECKGGSETSAGISTGQVHEEQFASVSGFKANTAYAVCLQVTNLEGETTESAPVSFTTANGALEGQERRGCGAVSRTRKINPYSGTECGAVASRRRGAGARVLVKQRKLSPERGNCELSNVAGINDQGQVSKLLARLEKHGLIENTVLNQGAKVNPTEHTAKTASTRTGLFAMLGGAFAASNGGGGSSSGAKGGRS